MRHIIALFGEAEKGNFSQLIHVSSLPQLADNLGNPPQESQGIPLAIQALLYQRELIYIRVKEEGFSFQDYMQGLKLLENRHLVSELHAVCLPGVGDNEIIEATSPICQLHNSLLILSQQDLYDYLTSLHLK